mgnify:CR=1 FL=1
MHVCIFCGGKIVFDGDYYVCSECGTVYEHEVIDERSVATKRGSLLIPARSYGSSVGNKDYRGNPVDVKIRNVPHDEKKKKISLPLPEWCNEVASDLVDQYKDCMKEKGVVSLSEIVEALAYVYCAMRGVRMSKKVGRAVYLAMECMGVKSLERPIEYWIKVYAKTPEVYKKALEIVKSLNISGQSGAKIATYLAEISLGMKPTVRLTRRELRLVQNLI